MPSDYSSIAEEHRRGYGDWVNEYAPALLADRYADSTHFIYELLQNAEDALKKRSEDFPNDKINQTIRFHLERQGFEAHHFGLLFRETDVRGICAIGRGTKKDDLTAIGKFGIGFKSVYAYTLHPEVHSGGEHFRIIDYVIPEPVEPRTAEPDETLFTLPFDVSSEDMTPEMAFRNVSNRLRNIGNRTLLFLQRIESVEWTIREGEKGTYLRESKPIGDDVSRVTLLGQKTGHEDDYEEWIVFEKPAFDRDQKACGAVQIAFRLGRNEKMGKDEVVPIRDSRICAFFETAIEAHLGFLVQAPFRTTPSRDNIPESNPHNIALATQLAKLLRRSLSGLRELGLLTVKTLEALPIESGHFGEGKLLRPLYLAVREALLTENLLPCYGEGYMAGNSARIARGKDLCELLSPAQLAQISGEPKVHWLNDEITEARKPLYPYLTQDLGIKTLDPEEILSNITKEFMESQTDSWVVELYRFLLDKRALWREPPPREPWGRGRLRDKPIIRLKDGTHVPPFRTVQDGRTRKEEPCAFLPVDFATEYPTVKREIARDNDALEFLKALGLREPDIADDVMNNVLPQYEKPSLEAETWGTYADNLRRIVQAWEKTDSESRKKELLERLGKCHFVRCTNVPSGETSNVKPDECYFPEEKLESFFAGEKDAWFVDKAVLEEGTSTSDLIKKCRVSTGLRVVAFPANLSEEKKGELRFRVTRSRGHDVEETDYTIHGLEAYLIRLSNTEQNTQSRISLLLWDLLSEWVTNIGEYDASNFLQGRYSWAITSGPYTQNFPSTLAHLLRESPWLPGPGCVLKRPSELCPSDLPEEFERHPWLISIKNLGFKPDDLTMQLRKLGLSERAVQRFLTRPLAEIEKWLSEAPELPIQPRPVGPTPYPPDEPSVTPRPQTPPPNQRRRTYVTPGTETTSPDQGERDRKGKVGVQVVAGYERRCAREPKIMPDKFPGYDIESKNADGELVRLIEVKSTTGEWNLSGVALTETQYDAARKNGDFYWLYVVEYVESAAPRIYQIQNPANKIDEYFFDDGWKALASNE